MAKTNLDKEIAIADESVMNQIYFIRKQKVMLDRDLAELYGVETKVLTEELQNWRSQFVTSNSDKQGLRYTPFCFTEQGVAMLSSVLNSKQAININIQIMRVFTRIRQMLTDNTELRLEIAELAQAVNKISKKQDGQDKNIDLIFEYIDRLQEKAEQPVPERKAIGFKVGDKKDK